MQVIIQPSIVSGTITAPASKSAMQRACAAALIKGGETILHNPATSADDNAALDIIQQLGANVEKNGATVIIRSEGVKPVNTSINCGESGLSVRMFTPIASLYNKAISINGHGSLTKRPLNFFDSILPLLDVQCKSNNGLLPLEVKGPLQPKNIEVDGSLSSQFLTGLLMAFAAAQAKDVTIQVENLASKPYIDLTLQVMRDFGLKVPENDQYKSFYFSDTSSNKRHGESLKYTVEGDWSGAAFLLVAGAINGNLEVRGLDVFSTQADKAVLQALMQAEAIMSVEEKKIQIRSNTLKAFHFNATDCPDLFPPLVALAACCEGTSVIEGVNRLAHKESNRGLTLKEEFEKMGIEIQLQDDLMIVKGGKLKGTTVSSHGDHRIAMACAVAALKADGPIIIEGAEAVNKSYPDFWKHLEQLQSS